MWVPKTQYSIDPHASRPWVTTWVREPAPYYYQKPTTPLVGVYGDYEKATTKTQLIITGLSLIALIGGIGFSLLKRYGDAFGIGSFVFGAEGLIISGCASCIRKESYCWPLKGLNVLTLGASFVNFVIGIYTFLDLLI